MLHSVRNRGIADILIGKADGNARCALRACALLVNSVIFFGWRLWATWPSKRQRKAIEPVGYFLERLLQLSVICFENRVLSFE